MSIGVRETGEKVLEEGIGIYEKHYNKRQDEWEQYSIKQMVDMIEAKVKKMQIEIDPSNYNAVLTPHMFDDDIRDLIMWTVFLKTKVERNRQITELMKRGVKE